MDAHAYANNKVEADTDAVVKSDSEGKADVFLKGNNYKNIKTSSKKFNDFFQISNKCPTKHYPSRREVTHARMNVRKNWKQDTFGAG